MEMRHVQPGTLSRQVWDKRGMCRLAAHAHAVQT